MEGQSLWLPTTRGAINILWLHFWSAVMSVIIIYSQWSGPQRWAMFRAMPLEWLKSLCLLVSVECEAEWLSVFMCFDRWQPVCGGPRHRGLTVSQITSLTVSWNMVNPPPWPRINKYGYCQWIHGEFTVLTNKKQPEKKQRFNIGNCMKCCRTSSAPFLLLQSENTM